MNVPAENKRPHGHINEVGILILLDHDISVNVSYIVFCTGCWSLSLTAGWSGHLFWHGLCRRSMTTSYTEAKMKAGLTKAQRKHREITDV